MELWQAVTVSALLAVITLSAYGLAAGSSRPKMVLGDETAWMTTPLWSDKEGGVYGALLWDVRDPWVVRFSLGEVVHHLSVDVLRELFDGEEPFQPGDAQVVLRGKKVVLLTKTEGVFVMRRARVEKFVRRLAVPDDVEEMVDEFLDTLR